MQKQSGQHGITLFELIITLAVVITVAFMAIPAFKGLIQKSKMTTSVNALVHSLHLARQISRTTGANIVICPAAGKQCGDQAHWSRGWFIFENLNEDSPPKISPGETLILIHETDSNPIGLSSNRSSYVMRPFGKRSTNGTFVFCDPSGLANAHKIVVSYTGKPRLSIVNNNESLTECSAGA